MERKDAVLLMEDDNMMDEGFIVFCENIKIQNHF